MCEAWKLRRGVVVVVVVVGVLGREGWTVMSVLPDRLFVMRSLRLAAPWG